MSALNETGNNFQQTTHEQTPDIRQLLNTNRKFPLSWGLVPLALTIAIAGCGKVTTSPENNSAIPGGTEPARVVRIVDGDTLHLKGEGQYPLPKGQDESVRLLLVDTPEVRGRYGKECFADEATDRLAKLAPPRSTVFVTQDRKLYDRYGRTLLYVWNSRGAFVNEELLRSGHAIVTVYEPNHRYESEFRRVESEAQREHRGLWGACEQPATGSVLFQSPFALLANK